MPALLYSFLPPQPRRTRPSLLYKARCKTKCKFAGMPARTSSNTKPGSQRVNKSELIKRENSLSDYFTSNFFHNNGESNTLWNVQRSTNIFRNFINRRAGKAMFGGIMLSSCWVICYSYFINSSHTFSINSNWPSFTVTSRTLQKLTQF